MLFPNHTNQLSQTIDHDGSPDLVFKQLSLNLQELDVQGSSFTKMLSKN